MPRLSSVQLAGFTLALLAVSALPGLAAAQDGDEGYRAGAVVGADAGYDYLSHDHYRYEGAPPQDPRVREQSGYRDGDSHIAPRTSYYAGVHLRYVDDGWYHRYGYYGYGYGCGCRLPYDGYAYVSHRPARDYDGYARTESNRYRSDERSDGYRTYRDNFTGERRSWDGYRHW